jgi:hypothetical protein
MSRGNSTITWGLALITAALFLAWTQSLPWALMAAGVVAVISGLIANTIRSIDAATESDVLTASVQTGDAHR